MYRAIEIKTPSTEANWLIYSSVKRRQQIHAFKKASAIVAGKWERAATVANRLNEGIWSDYRIPVLEGSGACKRVGLPMFDAHIFGV